MKRPPLRPVEDSELTPPILMEDATVAILAANFHQDLVNRMLADARQTLLELGIEEENIDEYRVPGSFELPTGAAWLCDSEQYDGIIALGVVIRGETAHFDYVCQAAANGLSQVAVKTGYPIMFGVLTTDTVEQAIERIDGRVERKGADVARGLAEMINLDMVIQRLDA